MLKENKPQADFLLSRKRSCVCGRKVFDSWPVVILGAILCVPGRLCDCPPQLP